MVKPGTVETLFCTTPRAGIVDQAVEDELNARGRGLGHQFFELRFSVDIRWQIENHLPEIGQTRYTRPLALPGFTEPMLNQVELLNIGPALKKWV